MEIKRCLLTKTTNDGDFAIYPKSSADLIDIDQNETVKSRLDDINNYGLKQNKLFTHSKMYPKAINGGLATTEEEITAVGGGWWDQVKGKNYGTIPSLIVHQRRMVEQKDEDGNRSVSPTIRLQNYVTYNHNGNPTTNGNNTIYTGESMCRITSAYHETIADGTVWSSSDRNTPNFTPVGIFAHNRFKGPAGMCAIFGRVKDVHYTDEELAGNSPSKSCAAGFYVHRLADYNQGDNNAKTSYSIALETWTTNDAQEDGLMGNQGYYGNTDFLLNNCKTWTCGYHLIGSGRRPITMGIYIQGSSTSKKVYEDGIDSNGNKIYKDLTDVNGDPLYTGQAPSQTEIQTIANGMYNAILIGASAMAIKGGNSPDTVGINMASWTASGFYGHTAIRLGYVPRFVKSRGPVYFQAPGFKFLNPNSDTQIAISAKENKSPYIVFKTGATDEERPEDNPRAKIGYNSPNRYFAIASDNDIRLCVDYAYAVTKTITNEDGSTTTIKETSTDNSVVYKFQDNYFFGTIPKITEDANTYITTNGEEGSLVQSYPILGGLSYPWQDIYLKNSPIIQSDTSMYSSPAISISNDLIDAWGSIDIKRCAYRMKYIANGTSSLVHFVIPGDIIADAFSAKQKNIANYAIATKTRNIDYRIDPDTNEDNSIYSVRYDQCFVLEAAYNRRANDIINASINTLTSNVTIASEKITNIETVIGTDNSNNTSIMDRLNAINESITTLNTNTNTNTSNINNTITPKLTELENAINDIKTALINEGIMQAD